MPTIVRGEDTVDGIPHPRLRAVAGLGRTIRAPGEASADDQMLVVGVALEARIEQDIADARAREEVPSHNLPRAPTIGGAEDAQPLIGVAREVVFARPSEDDVRILAINDDTVDRQRRLEVAQRLPVLAAIGRLPDAALGCPDVDSARVVRINRNGEQPPGYWL